MQQLSLPVCSIKRQPDYFPEKPATTVRIGPTPETSRKLRRARLLVKYRARAAAPAEGTVIPVPLSPNLSPLILLVHGAI